MEKRYTINDVLVGIYTNFPEGVNVCKHNLVKLNKFFFENREKYSVIDNLAFDENEIYSSDLEESYNDLKHTGLLGSDMDFRKDFIQSSCKVRWEKFSKKEFSEKELNEVKDLSSKFYEEFKI